MICSCLFSRLERVRGEFWWVRTIPSMLLITQRCSPDQCMSLSSASMFYPWNCTCPSLTKIEIFLYQFCSILPYFVAPSALSVCNKYEEAAEPIRPPLHQPVATTSAEEMPKRNKKHCNNLESFFFWRKCGSKSSSSYVFLIPSCLFLSILSFLSLFFPMVSASCLISVSWNYHNYHNFSYDRASCRPEAGLSLLWRGLSRWTSLAGGEGFLINLYIDDEDGNKNCLRNQF